MIQYDVAVIGAEFGGLVSAALLSAKGKKALVCFLTPSESGESGTAEKAGFTFSRYPALSHGIEERGVLHTLLRELTIAGIEPEYVSSYQVALPDRRVTVFSDIAKTLEEISREFPHDVQQAEAFYENVQRETSRIAKSRIAGFLSRHKSARSFLKKYGFSGEFNLFLDLQSRYFYQRSVDDLALPDLFTLCRRRPFRSSAWYGMLFDRLSAYVKSRGGEIRAKKPITGIAFQDDRAVGVRTADRIIESRSIVLASDEQSLHTLSLGIREEVIPVGMERDVLYLPDYSKPHDFIVFSMSAHDDAAAAPLGMRSLSVAFYGQENEHADKALLISRASGLMPFLQDFLVQSEIAPIMGLPAFATGLVFKPVKTGKEQPHLFRGAKKNIYLFQEQHQSPMRMMPAVQKLVSMIG